MAVSEAPSLYRRHRPRTFSQVVGQEHVVRTLRNAVEQDKVHHAYLFVGSRGTGKTSMAKILAACVNCVHGPTVEPCGVCESCTAIASATSLDVIEMDAASNNSVDDIRDLRERVGFAPVSGRHKVYILDEAHMLSSQAWNAFLKTLEEPPPNTIFVLATTEADKVLPTVVDRCHRFDFTRPTIEQITAVLRRVADQEQIAIPPDAVALLARHATGSFRDALGTLEQLVTYAGIAGSGDGRQIATQDVLAVLGVADADLLFGALDAIAAADARAALHAAAQLARTGRDATAFARDLEAHARDLLIVRTLGEVPPELRITPDRDARLADQAGRVGSGSIALLLDLLAAALQATRNGADARTQLELALVKAATPEVQPSAQALLARIERLEAALCAASPAGTSPPPTRAESPLPPTEPAEQPESPAPPAEPGPEAPVPPSGPPPPPEAPAPSPEQTAASAPARPPNGAVASVAVDIAPPSDPASAARPLDLDGLRAAWPAVLDTLRATNTLCAALLADARPVALAGGQLTVAFPTGADFLRRKAQSTAYRECVTAAIRTVTGQSARIDYELRDVEGAHPGAVAPVALTEEEWVARFVAEFDAEEIVPDIESESEAT